MAMAPLAFSQTTGNHGETAFLDVPLSSAPSSSKPGSTGAQARAWFHALSPGQDARDRLAEALTEGADPWSTMAVTRGWRVTGSTSLVEAVMNAESLLGAEETMARMALLARYAQPSRDEERDQQLGRVLLAAIGRRWPSASLDAWLELADSTQEFTRMAFPLLKDRILNAGQDAVDTLKWTHLHVRPLSTWEPSDIQALEHTDNADLRDAYWSLRRQALAKPHRVGRA